LIGRKISHYEIVSKLGEGGMGVVYKANDPRLERHVAIKFLPEHLSADAAAKSRFIREAKAASALEHPHICHIYEIDELPTGELFMVMPCYEGETLRDRLDREPMEVADALEIAVQLASGLARAHEKGIVHRDIKPGNVMLTDGGRQAKLMDFGLAKKPDATQVTRTGTTVGTVAYMSPEQAMGEDTDGRTDVWSLGVMLYEMLAGKLPFRGEVEPAVVYSIINEEPKPIRDLRPDVPVEVETILEKALAKDRDKRYQNAAEFLEELEQERDRLALGIKRRYFKGVRRKTRRRLLRVVVPVAVVIVAAAAVYLVNRYRPLAPEAYAERNSMAVMYFENMADPVDEDRTAQAITNLLTTGLSRSKYVTVVSQQHLYDILKQMGREDVRRVDKRVASEVAKRAGVRMFVAGTVIQVEPNIVVSSQIIDRSSGDILETTQVRGEPGEDVLAVADKLIGEIGRSLAIPDEAKQQFGESVKGVTTSSEDAFRAYLQGEEQNRKLYWDEAAESYAKAIEYDSTFATAYARLAQVKWLMCAESGKCEPDEVRRLVELAKRHSEKLTDLEKMYLEARSAQLDRDYLRAKDGFLKIVADYPDEKSAWENAGDVARVWLAQPEEAMRYYENAIAIDSTYGVAYGFAALCYETVGDTDKAMRAANRYVSLSPNEAQPYDVRAVLYAGRGMVDEAIADFQKAEELMPGFTDGRLERAYLMNGDYALADSLYRAKVVSGEPHVRRYARGGLALVRMRQGKFNDALELLDDAIGAERIEEMIYLARGELDLAKQQVEIINGAVDRFPTGYWSSYLSYRTLSGQVDEAEQSLPIIKAKVDDLSPVHAWRYWWPKGYVEMATGDPDSAIAYLERSAWGAHRKEPWNEWTVRYFLALVLLELDRLPAAARQLEDLVLQELTSTMESTIWTVRVRYLLGVTYERLGRPDAAVAMYQKFLDMWKDADPGLEEVADARERLARLRGSR
jgi:tetratricopeptide (TPR) repeat protein/tRNA A-37 threonylcarbamoyl transferase component Bud32